MQIPKSIDNLLTERRNLAEKLNAVDVELCNQLQSLGISLMEPCLIDSLMTGVLMYSEPSVAESNIREYLNNYNQEEL